MNGSFTAELFVAPYCVLLGRSGAIDGPILTKRRPCLAL